MKTENYDIDIAGNLKYYMDRDGMTRRDISEYLGVSFTAVCDWLKGKRYPRMDKIERLAALFGVKKSDLIERKGVRALSGDDVVTIPILGNVAAGFDRWADVSQEVVGVEIPTAWLHGRRASDIFALGVSGDSMFPDFQDGDVVICLRASDMGRSGRVGVVMDCVNNESTLKRINYVPGEDWMELEPLNRSYPRRTISGPDLENWRVQGIVIRVLREIVRL